MKDTIDGIEALLGLLALPFLIYMFYLQVVGLQTFNKELPRINATLERIAEQHREAVDD